MAVLVQRVNRVEEALAAYLSESARVRAEIREDIAEIRASNARTDRQLLAMQQEAARDRAEAARSREQAERDREEAVRGREEAARSRERDREEFERNFQRAEKERKDFNRRLAEVTDNQGLMIENMVWPNLKRIASEAFCGGAVNFQAIRVKRRHPMDRGRLMELDLLAIGDAEVLICEAKSKVSPEKVREFSERLASFSDYFPECHALKVRLMVASVAFDASVVQFMSSRGVLALGFGGETMDLLNPEILGAPR